MTVTNLEEVAEYLLNEGLHVTALELNSELLRNQGRELSTVRRYFTSNSSPPSTRASISHGASSSSITGPIRITQQHRASTPIVKKSPSVQTFDSLDLARGSDDGAGDQTTEKIAVIEYELRKANETIATLRASLTEAISSNKSKHNSEGEEIKPGQTTAKTDSDDHDDDSIKPHERKAIAFIIHDFLMSQSCKMTAITLSEEINDQNFNSWFDVGLDTPEPPSLLKLFRSQSRTEPSNCRQCDKSNYFSIKGGENQSLTPSGVSDVEVFGAHERLSQSTQTDTPVSITNEERFTNTSQPSSLLTIQVEDKSCQTDRLLSFLRRSNDEESSPDTSTTGEDGGEAKTLAPNVFRSALISEANLMVESEISFQLMSSESELIALLAHDLPIIASHITCGENRADLLPLIVSTAALIPRQSDSSVSDKLLYTFFDLIPSPNVLHRKLIVSALVTLAHVYSQKRVQDEILPIIWEQLTHRSSERKILIIDSCIQLLPLVCSSIRASLILSILSTLFNEEKDSHVREAAIKGLAYLTSVLAEDESSHEKWDVILKQILSPCLIETEITSISHDTSLKRCFNRFFMPAFAYWSLKIKKLAHLTNVLVTSAINHHKSHIAIGSLEICVPFIFLNLVTSTPTAKSLTSLSSSNDDKGHRFCFINNKLLNLQVIAGSSVGDMIGHFDQLLARDWFKPWQEWDEFDRKILPLLLSTLIPNCTASQLPQLLSLCSSLGQHLGLSVLRLKVKPILLRAMYQEMNEASNLQMDSDGTSEDGKESKDNQENQSVQMLLPSFAAVVISVKPIQEEEKRDLSTCLSKCLLLGHTKAVVDAVAFIVGEAHSEATRNDLNGVIVDFLRQSIGHSANVDLSIIKILDCFISDNSRVSLSREATVCLVDDALSIIDQIDVKSVPSNASIDTKHNYCIACYASLLILILSNAQCESLLQCVYSKLDSLLEEEHIESHINLVQLLARVARSSSQHIVKEKSHVFLDYSLPRLAAITVQCRSNTSNKKKQELILALLDCYTKFSFLNANDQLVRESVLPSLRLAKAEVASIAPEYDETVVALIQEFERKLNETVIHSAVASSSTIQSTQSTSSSSQLNKASQATGNITSPLSSPSAAPIATPCLTGNSNSGEPFNKHPMNPDLKTRFKGFFNKKL